MTHWTELKTCDADGNETRLKDFMADCVAGIGMIGAITLNDDGSLATWDQRYVYADGEMPSATSPAGEIDWTGFSEQVAAAVYAESF